jgi:hypothetical protein
MTEGRRSRRGWSTTPIPPPEPDPVQRRLTPIVAAYVCIVGLVLTIGVLLFFIEARSHSRDVEQQQTTQQIERLIHANNCALMDGLPRGGPLDRLRATNHCGPGLPISHP